MHEHVYMDSMIDKELETDEEWNRYNYSSESVFEEDVRGHKYDHSSSGAGVLRDDSYDISSEYGGGRSTSLSASLSVPRSGVEVGEE